MIVHPYVSTKTYHIKDYYSISLIYDVKHVIYYLLKGISSNLWELIVKYQDFDRVFFYAKNNNLENELKSLLYELKEKEIISTNKTFEKSNYNYLANAISDKSSNFKYFYLKWLNFTYNNNFINSLILELNYKCNLNCKHCYNHKNMNECFMTFEQAKKIIDEAYDLGIFCVKLTGGECTLNKDFLKICEYIRNRHLELCINSNGQILNDNTKMFENFINLYPSSVQVSLYSMDENVHDFITGVKGSWQKSVNVIKKLKNAGIYTKIATTVLAYNKDCYKEIKQFANAIGVKFGFNCLFINNPENNNLCSKLNYNDIEQFYNDNLDLNNLRNYFEKTDKPVCEAGRERLCVTPKLDVTPCVAVDYTLGNLNTTTLKEIKETTLQDFKKKFIRKNLTECFKEEYCKYCFYCSDTASFNNTFMKKQPILCENAKAFYNAYSKFINVDS